MGLSERPGATPESRACGTWWGFPSPRQPARTHPHCARLTAGVRWYGRVLRLSFGRKRGVRRAASFETFLGTYSQEVGIRSITDTPSPLAAQAQKAKEPTESALGSPSLQVPWNLPSVCRIWVLFALRQ